MKVNPQKIRQLRQNRLWSQEQFAELCDLNIRTIQRVETQGNASVETVAAMAAVFEVNADVLSQQQGAKLSLSNSIPSAKDSLVFKIVIAAILAIYLGGLPALFVFNWLTTPEELWSLRVFVIMLFILAVLVADFAFFVWRTQRTYTKNSQISQVFVVAELSFVFHLFSYLFVVCGLWVVNTWLNPQQLDLQATALWWLLALLIHSIFYFAVLFISPIREQANKDS